MRFIMVKVFNFEDDPNEFSANTYVIGKIGDSCIIVDIGSTKEEVLDYISSHYERVAAVLLTHGHFDHIRGLPKLLKRFKDVPVYISNEDKELLSNPEFNASDMTGEKVSMNIETIPVEDGETIKLGKYHVKVIATPFHTMGSVCYLFEDDNALFTGDSLFRTSIGRADLKTSDPDLIMSSMKKLCQLDDNIVIYPGHGSISRMEIEKRTNSFLIRALKNI